MYRDFEAKDQLPSLHISSQKISFILGAGPIESAVEENEKKEDKNNKKTYYIYTFFAFISSLLKF